MDEGIVIFDCIEFNELFRYDDVAAEVAFLAMDLDYNGYPDYSDVFLSMPTSGMRMILKSAFSSISTNVIMLTCAAR